jgi:hypothetical protein
MEGLRAILIGLGIGAGLSAPAVFFYRRQIIGSWREVFGSLPPGTISPVAPPPSAAVRRFRRPWPLVILQVLVVFASASVTVTGGPVAAILSALVCLVTSFSLGLNIFVRGADRARIEGSPSD